MTHAAGKARYAHLMLKFLKGVLLALSVVALIVTVVLIVNGWIQVDRLWAVATANQSGNRYTNPRNLVLLVGAFGALTGLLLGFGLGVPKQTYKQMYEDRQRVAADQYKASHAVEQPAPAADEPVAAADEPDELVIDSPKELDNPGGATGLGDRT